MSAGEHKHEFRVVPYRPDDDTPVQLWCMGCLTCWDVGPAQPLTVHYPIVMR